MGVEDGFVIHETRAADFPSIVPGHPELGSRGCPRGAPYTRDIYFRVRGDRGGRPIAPRPRSGDDEQTRVSAGANDGEGDEGASGPGCGSR
ncbi:hypothetical protein BJF83_12170 [Nocardiopsis sp. CNR-923]|nr:hypothetical protein BJF83_12170 [Nocardiopsis sp. CNR-923]